MPNHSQVRRIRIDQIINLIGSAMRQDKDIDFEKFVANFSLDYAIARRTIIEYLHTLEAAGKIVIERKDNLKQIWTTEAYRADKILESSELNSKEVKNERDSKSSKPTK